jgi:hypothetical protein
MLRNKLLTATAVILSLALTSCGGGGGGTKDTSDLYTNPATTTTTTLTTASVTIPDTGLTVVSTATKSITTRSVTVTAVPNYLFTSGLVPKLVCSNGVFSPDVQDEYHLHFAGDTFTNCTLTFTAPDTNAIVYTALDAFNATSGSAVAISDNLTLSTVTGTVEMTPLADADGDKVADTCEGKMVTEAGMESATPYQKTVIIVMEGDDLSKLSSSEQSLTAYLEKNYDYLVSGIQSANPTGVKFVVIWDGAQESGVDGNSDVFILDPSTGKTFSVLSSDISNVLSGDSVSNYYADGIRFWFAESDNLSNHLKELIEIAAKMYPANSYDLIISDHGDGWVSQPTPTTRTVLFEYYNDGSVQGGTWLGTKQFADNVLAPLSKEGIKFDLLGFDECLMGELASLSVVQPYAKVIVASPEYEMGDGWATVYQDLPSWYAAGDSDWTIAKNIVDEYVSYYTNNPPNVANAYPQVIGLTAVNSTALLNLKNAFEQFAGDLYQTAQNEVNDGQMYDVFYSFANNYLSTGVFNDNVAFWGTITTTYDFSSDPTAVELDNATSYYISKGIDYHSSYGQSQSTGQMGYDLLYAVTRTGLAARLAELGVSADQLGIQYFIYGTTPQFLTPSFASNTVTDALNFLSTYNSTVANDQLYTKYLLLNMDGTVSANVTGSGLSLIYPYTSPDYASSPKLELCNYQNFVDSYNGTLPNYAGFVETVFGEMWKALNDSGLSSNFYCSTTGNIVWNNQ